MISRCLVLDRFGLVTLLCVAQHQSDDAQATVVDGSSFWDSTHQSTYGLEGAMNTTSVIHSAKGSGDSGLSRLSSYARLYETSRGYPRVAHG